MFLLLFGLCGILPSVQAQTPYYHIERSYSAVDCYIAGTPTVADLYAEAEELTETVAGTIKLNTNGPPDGTYAIEKQMAITVCYNFPEDAWNAVVNYNGTPSNYPGKIFDNVGWVLGTKNTDSGWGAYLWILQNRIAFQASTSEWWTTTNGLPIAITNVIVGTLGDYQAMSNVVDVGPYLDGVTNRYLGPNYSDDRAYRVDITNVFYQLSIPDIWITPRYAVTNVGGTNIQYTVTGTNIPQGVTWSLIPSGLSSGAVIQASNDWHFASVTPGDVGTNYKVRATSVDNTNFYDQVDLAVVGMQSFQYRIGTNSWTNLPDPLYISKNTAVDFKALKAPADASWPTNKPVWGGVVSGAGTETNSYTFSSVSSSTSDYKVVTAECGNTITGRVIVIDNVVVTNIKFNHDTASSSSDAVNIRQDYNTAYDISNGEWVKGVTNNLPVCYTINKAVTIKARLTMTPAVNVTADIWAVSTDSGGSLSDVVKTNVVFSGGVSSPEYVTFLIAGTTTNCIRKTTNDVWEWKLENVNGSHSPEWDLNTSDAHTVYTILNEPVSPWVNTADNKTNAWTKALDFIIVSASCNGDSSASAALAHIAQYIHGNVFGMAYDTSLGQSHYGMDLGTNGYFNFTSYINGGGTVNCYDQAAGVTVCSRLIGESCTYLFMNPFGYIYATDLVGIGQCNNPFYPGLSAPNNVPLLGTNGITDLVFTNRSAFGNHAFVKDGGNLYDATCGPHLGNETLTQYATNAIDISSSAESTCPYYPSPDAPTNGNGDGIISTSEADAATVSGDVSWIY